MTRYPARKNATAPSFEEQVSYKVCFARVSSDSFPGADTRFSSLLLNYLGGHDAALNELLARQTCPLFSELLLSRRGRRFQSPLWTIPVGPPIGVWHIYLLLTSPRIRC